MPRTTSRLPPRPFPQSPGTALARPVAVASAASILAAVLTAGCGGGVHHAQPVGSLALAAKVPDGVVVTDVNYSITGHQGPPIDGRFPSGHGPAAPLPLVVVNDLPAGAGYRVDVQATLAGAPACQGSESFDIHAGETTAIVVVLSCSGTVKIGIQLALRYCPHLATYSAAPLTTSAGGTVALHATAVAYDADTGPPVWFQWSATSGSFSDPSAADTTYTCAAGQQMLSVAVSNGSCSDSVAIPVNCVTGS
jgi:hypothetical protein